MTEKIPNPDWNQFAEEDPFNPGCFVEGWISHHNGDDYGALLIEKVNNVSSSQLIYCFGGDTRVLTADLRWVPIEQIQVGQWLLAFDEEIPARHKHRRLQWSQVLAVSERIANPVRAVFEDGSEVTCTPDHRVLTKGGRWIPIYEGSYKRTKRVWKLCPTWESEEPGWLAGLYDGEGTIALPPKYRVSVSQKEGFVLEEVRRQLTDRGFRFDDRETAGSARVLMHYGGFPEFLRFLGQVRPLRLLDKFQRSDLGRTTMRGSYVQLKSARRLRATKVYDLTTSTGTFIAEGFAVHNCTPKIRYPFDAAGRWHFPKAKRIERYEKLDGTNIFAFWYFDDRGHKKMAFKTRLKPFLGDSRFGPFRTMWQEMMRNQEGLRELVTGLVMGNGYGASFELWGARNPHTVRYEEPALQASLLFARKHSREIGPPSVALDYSPLKSLVAPFLGTVDRDYVWSYEEAQRQHEATLKEVDGGYLGSEGEVWYLQTEDGLWQMFKCKPETIEQIHWAAGGIGKNQVLATCWNALEGWDAPTAAQVRQLLEEEFTAAEVDKAYYMVERCLEAVLDQGKFRVEVLEAYRFQKEMHGLSVLTDKVGVMRRLGMEFPRAQMGKVYSIVWGSEVR